MTHIETKILYNVFQILYTSDNYNNTIYIQLKAIEFPRKIQLDELIAIL